MGQFLWNPSTPGATSFTVPAGVTSLWCCAAGGIQLNAAHTAMIGLPEAQFGILAVTPGQVLTLVAGAGTAVAGATASPSSLTANGVVVLEGLGAGGGGTRTNTLTAINSVAGFYPNLGQNYNGYVMVEWGQATFPYAGKAYTFPTPPGVKWMGATLTGGCVWNPVTNGYVQGGKTLATIPVSGSIQVNVGGSNPRQTPAGVQFLASTEVGFNGAGTPDGTGDFAGGGGTDVRVGGTALANRLATAGGAGGFVHYIVAVGGVNFVFAFAGGQGGINATAGIGTGLGDAQSGQGGFPGTGTAGGRGGTGPIPGLAGTLGQGGNSVASSGGAGGSGGGGFYGGGSGGSGVTSTTGEINPPGAPLGIAGNTTHHPGGGGGGGSNNVSASVFSGTSGPQAESTTVMFGSATLTWAATPLAPTLDIPIPGTFADLAGVSQFVFNYNPATEIGGAPLAGYVFRRRVSGAGAYQYWNAAGQLWQSTAVVNATTIAEVDFPVGAWTDGATYQWNIASVDANGNQGPFAATDGLVTAQAGGTVTFNTPAAGQIFSDSPTVTVVGSPPQGATITGYRVLVYPAALTTPAGFEPGVTAGAVFDTGNVTTTAATYTVVASGFSTGAYVAYAAVFVSNIGNGGAYNGVPFVVSGAVPIAPTIQTVQTADPFSGQPGISIVVTDPNGGIFEGNPTSAVVQRLAAGEWVELPASPVAVVGNVAILTDFYVPLNEAVQYRASITATLA